MEMTTPLIQCARCVYYIKKRKCKAFNNIPIKILLNQYNHTKPYKGDNGIRFKAVKQ
jgi:hypothetical protein